MEVGVKIEGRQAGHDLSYKWVEKLPPVAEIESGIPLEQYPTMLDKINTSDQFRLLCKMTQTTEHQGALLRIDKRFDHLNRYKDIVPYYHTRVELLSPRIPPPRPGVIEEGEPDEVVQTYINASFIHVSLAPKLQSSLADDQRFIAAQAPLNHTLQDFWKMVLERDVGLIMMLCQLEEYGRPKCGEYFPQTLQTPELRLSERISITLEHMERLSDNLLVRYLRVRDFSESRRGKLVTQYQFGAWPDHSAPEAGEFQDIRSMVDAAVSKILSPGQDGFRILVHCSAGIGRTGTLIALINIELALRRMISLKSPSPSLRPRISVFAIVRRMREQRYQMVQSEVQFTFIHDYFRQALAHPL